MNQQIDDIWLLAFGNPGRCDDGLGPALAEAIERLSLPGVTVESDYQLTVEDAAEAAKHEIVLFADATAIGPAPFWMKRIEPDGNTLGFSSHGVEPEAVLALAKDLFGAKPEAYLIGIRGYNFDAFGMELSTTARSNLEAAVAYLRTALPHGRFRESAKRVEQCDKSYAQRNV